MMNNFNTLCVLRACSLRQARKTMQMPDDIGAPSVTDPAYSRLRAVQFVRAGLRAFVLLATAFALLAVVAFEARAQTAAACPGGNTPCIVSIKRVSGLDERTGVVAGGAFNADFIITTNEPVTNLDNSDFAPAANGERIDLTDYFATSLAGVGVGDDTVFGIRYGLIVDMALDDGEEIVVSLILRDNATIDAGGRDINTTLPTGDNNETFTIDRHPPVYASVAVVDSDGGMLASDGTATWTAGETITISWTFDEPVKGLDAADISLVDLPAAQVHVGDIMGNDTNTISADLTLGGAVQDAGTVMVRLDPAGITDMFDNAGTAAATMIPDISFTSAFSELLSLELSPDTISEDGGVSTVTLSMSRAPNEDVTFMLAVAGSGDNPAADEDFTLADDSLTILEGTTSATTTITATGNDVHSLDKTLEISTTYGFIGVADTLTLQDNELLPTITISTEVTEIMSSDGMFSQTTPYVLTRSGDLTAALDNVMVLPIAGSTQRTAETINFAAGSATANGPDLDDVDLGSATTSSTILSYTIVESAAYMVGPDNEVTILLTDSSDEAPGLITDTTQIAENGGVATLKVVLAEAVTGAPVMLTLGRLGSSTAVLNTDYEQSGSTFTIAVGETESNAITVTAMDDNTNEASDLFIVLQTSAMDPLVASNSVRLSIRDDDDLPAVSISFAGDDAEDENHGPTIVVARTGDTTNALNGIRVERIHRFGEVSFQTVNIAAGNSEFRVQILNSDIDTDNNNLADGHTSVTVRVLAGPGYTVGEPASATQEIIDDDPALTLTFSPPEITEGEMTTLHLELSSSTSATTTITLTPASDSALTVGSNSIVIPPNQRRASTTVLAVDNTDDEAADPTYEFMATAPFPVRTVVRNLTATATLTVRDDDGAGDDFALPFDVGPYTFPIGLESNLLLPAAANPSGGNAGRVSYTLTGRLPAGLRFDPDGPRIRGTPITADMALVTYQATDNMGDSDADNDVESEVTVEVSTESATLELALEDASITENGGTTTLTATLTPAAMGVIVPLSHDGGDDITLATSLTIAAGATTGTTTVTARNNDDIDGDREVVITGGSFGVMDDVTLTIVDDEVFSLPELRNYTFAAGQTVNVTLPAALHPLRPDTVFYTLNGPDGTLTTLGGADLPTGLVFDGTAGSRVLSGTPETAATAETYTYKATDDKGDFDPGNDEEFEDTFTITINLALADATGALASGVLRFEDLADPDNPVTFPEILGMPTDDTSYTLTLANGDPLPEWLMFDETTRVLTVDMAQARGRMSLLYRAFVGTDPNAVLVGEFSVMVGDDSARREARLGEMVGAVGRTLGWDMAETIRNRARAGRAGTDSPLRLSGVSGDTTLDDLVSRGASVDMALNAAADDSDAGGVSAGRLWAKVRRSEFDNEPLNDYEQDGSLTSVHAGVDFRNGPDRLFGAAIGWHDAEVDYEDRDDGTEGDLELELLTVNPYASQTRDRWHAWGTAGFGVGEMTLAEQPTQGGDEQTSQSDVTLLNAAGGLEYTADTIGKADLVARGEGMFLTMDVDGTDNDSLEYAQFRSDVYGLRGEVEIGLPMTRADGGTMRPFVVMGMRWDDGDDSASGLTAELGGGITARNQHLFVDADLRTRTGVDDKAADVLAWSLSLGLDANNDNRGFAVELQHKSGPQPWDPFANDGLTAASADTEDTPATLGATTRYALDYRNGQMTPYNTLSFDGGLLSEVETGIRYRLSDISLGLKHVYEPGADPDEHTLKLTGQITF